MPAKGCHGLPRAATGCDGLPRAATEPLAGNRRLVRIACHPVAMSPTARTGPDDGT